MTTSADDQQASRTPSTGSEKDVTVAVTPVAQAHTAPPSGMRSKGVRFWLIFLAICVSLFLSALEFTAVSTALPIQRRRLGSARRSVCLRG
ncbi:hypothetical protein PsYK624_050350 [Phanerochaete sordida]|uniref:Major facilitator superfamily (MFS) profile domain-containing protein n=1 Tax=Phanerochaete sordida TaxID=48140 RepID=A0A9P3LCJ8_9APHY|nr:hypothetical protein PsYK624_050350 [Phanerochaete sordida]